MKSAPLHNLLARIRRDVDVDRAPPAWLGALGGAALLLLAVAFIVGGVQLGVGEPRRLGTGAFPVLTGLSLATLALAIIAIDLRAPLDAERPDWISFAAIGIALMVFAVAVDRFGLVLATFLTTVVASLPDRSLALPGKLVLGAIVALSCWGVFIGLLDIPFTAFKGI